MLTVLQPHGKSSGSKKGKVTCTTCGLKKCLGRCHFERTDHPRGPKAA